MEKIDLNNKTILVTGAAGFIGSFLCKKLLETTDLQDIYKLISSYIQKKTIPNPMEKYKEKLQKITTFIFDFSTAVNAFSMRDSSTPLPRNSAEARTP